jgi:DNA-directed RNA polymerase specialized sigma subunit
MAEFFSKTAYDRLPASVRKLDKNAQTVCIHLRLRKTPEAIAGEMKLSPDDASRVIAEVRRTLIASGNYDMIADPVFVPLGGDDGVEPVMVEADMEDKILAGNFLAALKKSFAGLPASERRLLHLFFGRRMTAKEICSFLAASGSKPSRKESELFPLLDKALKKLLDSLSQSTPIGRGTLTVKGLREILDQTGASSTGGARA